MPTPQENWLSAVSDLERGDTAAMSRLNRVITGFLVRYGAFRQRDNWDDLRQEVLLALVRSVRTGAIHEPDAFISYAGRVTHSKLIDALRGAKRPGVAVPADAAGIAGGAAAGALPGSPGTRLRDDLLDLRTAVGELDERERDVIESIYLEGRSYQETADRMGIPFGSLKRIQTRGLRSLRERMDVTRGA